MYLFQSKRYFNFEKTCPDTKKLPSFSGRKNKCYDSQMRNQTPKGTKALASAALLRSLGELFAFLRIMVSVSVSILFSTLLSLYHCLNSCHRAWTAAFLVGASLGNVYQNKFPRKSGVTPYSLEKQVFGLGKSKGKKQCPEKFCSWKKQGPKKKALTKFEWKILNHMTWAPWSTACSQSI